MRVEVEEKKAYWSWNIFLGSTNSVSCTMLHAGQNAVFNSKKYSSLNCSAVRKTLAIGIRPKERNGATFPAQIRHLDMRFILLWSCPKGARGPAGRESCTRGRHG